jgi:hypothetical protein
MTGVAFLIVSAILGVEPSVPLTAPPESPPPQFGIAMINEKSGIDIRYAESATVWNSFGTLRLVQVREGDISKIAKETTIHKVRQHQVTPAVETRDAGHYRVFRKGAVLDEKTRVELLKQPRRVVFLESALFAVRWPDEFYLDLLADDTLVVLLDVLKTPEVKVDAAHWPPASLNRSAVPPPREPPGPDGRYWRESLWLAPNGATEVGHHPSGLLLPEPDPDLGIVLFMLRKRPDIIRKGWIGPQPNGRIGELTWFGHRTTERPGKAARISFGVHESKPGTIGTVPYFLAVVNANTKPQLVLTADQEAANLWNLTAEKTWVREPERGDDDNYTSEHTVGYIQAAGIPGAPLWLALSPKPILQTYRDGIRGNTETSECSLLTISPKKESLFYYVRDWSERN